MWTKRLAWALALALCAPAIAWAALFGTSRMDGSWQALSGTRTLLWQNNLRGYALDYYINADLGVQTPFALQSGQIYIDRYVNKNTKVFWKAYQLNALSADDTQSLLQFGIDAADMQILWGKHIFYDLTHYAQPMLGLQATYKPWALTTSLGQQGLGLRGQQNMDQGTVFFSLLSEGWNFPGATLNLTVDTQYSMPGHGVSLRGYVESSGSYGAAAWSLNPSWDVLGGQLRGEVQGNFSSPFLTYLAADRRVLQGQLAYRKSLALLSDWNSSFTWREQLTDLSDQPSVDQTRSNLVALKSAVTLPGFGKWQGTLQYQTALRPDTALSPLRDQIWTAEAGWQHVLIDWPFSLTYKRELGLDQLTQTVHTQVDAVLYSLRFPFGPGFTYWNGYSEYAQRTGDTVRVLGYQINVQYLWPMLRNFSSELRFSREMGSSGLSQSETVELHANDFLSGFLTLRASLTQAVSGVQDQQLAFSYQRNLSFEAVPLGLRQDSGALRAQILAWVFHDANSNGVPDANERRFEGVVLRAGRFQSSSNGQGRIDLKVNLKVPQEQVTAVLDESALPFEFMSSLPTRRTVSLTAGDSSTLYFPIQVVKYIQGRVFNDQNQNGLQDSDETGIPWALLRLDDTRTFYTRADGSFRVFPVTPLAHTLALDSHYFSAEAHVTNPAALQVNISADAPGVEGIAIGVYVPDKQRRQKSF